MAWFRGNAALSCALGFILPKLHRRAFCGPDELWIPHTALHTKLAFEGLGIGDNLATRRAFDDYDCSRVLRYVRMCILSTTRLNQCLEILITCV